MSTELWALVGAVIAGLIGVLYGKGQGRREAEARQAKEQARARQIARVARQKADAMDDASVRRASDNWVRNRER